MRHLHSIDEQNLMMTINVKTTSQKEIQKAQHQHKRLGPVYRVGPHSCLLHRAKGIEYVQTHGSGLTKVKHITLRVRLPPQLEVVLPYHQLGVKIDHHQGFPKRWKMWICSEMERTLQARKWHLVTILFLIF